MKADRLARRKACNTFSGTGVTPHDQDDKTLSPFVMHRLGTDSTTGKPIPKPRKRDAAKLSPTSDGITKGDLAGLAMHVEQLIDYSPATAVVTGSNSRAITTWAF